MSRPISDSSAPTLVDPQRSVSAADYWNRIFAGCWVHCVVIIATFLAMLSWTWFGWNDPIIDFGRELYVPWQLLQGKVLYRDIAYFNGPLSPYFNALVFGVAGVSLRSLVFANLCILAVLAVLVWNLCRIAADLLTATVITLVLLTVFAFIQLGGVANYNFVTPYSHEITHGVTLGLAGIACVHLATRASGFAARVWMFAACVILGLTFLTKVEVFLAAGVAIGGGIVLIVRKPFELAMLAAIATVPAFIAFVLMCLTMPARNAARAVLGSWIYLFDQRITGMRFYQEILGTADLPQSLRAILAATVVLIFVIMIAWGMARLLPRRTGATWLAGIIALAAAALIFWQVDLGVWQQSVRWLTVVSPVLALLAAICAVRRRDALSMLRAMLATFAALLLSKIIFNVHVYHYGFALAMPATLVALAGAVYFLPKIVRQHGGNAQAFRAVMLVGAGLFAFVHLYVFATLFSRNSILEGSGPDQFYVSNTDPRGHAVKFIVEALRKLPADKTVATVPEGTMIGYLSRRTNPTPFITLMPPEVVMFGQNHIAKAYADHPPDYIVMVERSDPAEYGFKGFAIDYGSSINNWIRENYVEVPQAKEPKFPIALLRKK